MKRIILFLLMCLICRAGYSRPSIKVIKTIDGVEYFATDIAEKNGKVYIIAVNPDNHKTFSLDLKPSSISSIDDMECTSDDMVSHAIKAVNNQERITSLEKKFIDEDNEILSLHFDNDYNSTTFHIAGAVGLSFGIPALIAGAALTGYGYSGLNGNEKVKSNCAIAGPVLLGYGGSLVTISIPLISR